MNPPIKIRHAKVEDLNFILNSWLKRYRDAIRARFVSDRDYYAIQHEVISKILAQPGLIALIACNPSDENQIFGYVVAEQSHLVPDLLFVHWTYTKGFARKYGIAGSLLKALPAASTVHYTHKTALVEFLDKSKQAIFNPAYCWAIL